MSGWTDPLLGQLPGSLVLRVPQQLHHSLLIRGKSSDLSDDALDKDLLLAVNIGESVSVIPIPPQTKSSSRLLALLVRGLDLLGEGGGRVTTVETVSQVCKNVSIQLLGHLCLCQLLTLT